jgi:Arc/MetJ-type ribon-helix-helix transcriptional regulator
MATLTVQIGESLKERLDREVESGRAKSHDDLVQLLLESAIDAKWKDEVDLKIIEALDDIERGDVVVHKRGDVGRLGPQYLHQKLLSRIRTSMMN